MIKSFLLSVLLMIFLGVVFAVTTAMLNHYQVIEYYNNWAILGFWFGWISALMVRALCGLHNGNNK